MSESLIALGAPLPFDWPGAKDGVLNVSAPTLRVERAFSARLERRTAAGIARCRDALGEDAYRDALREFGRDLAVGAYEWTGDVARAARCTPQGSRELGFVSIRELQPDFTEAEMEAVFRDKEKWEELVEILRRLQEPPPNGQPPAKAGGASSEQQT